MKQRLAGHERIVRLGPLVLESAPLNLPGAIGSVGLEHRFFPYTLVECPLYLA